LYDPAAVFLKNTVYMPLQRGVWIRRRDHRRLVSRIAVGRTELGVFSLCAMSVTADFFRGWGGAVLLAVPITVVRRLTGAADLITADGAIDDAVGRRLQAVAFPIATHGI
jgi:hypothetical protein